MKIGAVIVAAGMSTRMKKFKQLLKIGDFTMAERVVMNFQNAGITDIVMVTGYQSELLIQTAEKLGITFLNNNKYETTQMIDSAKIGFAYMKDRCDKILFCPVDVPLFTADTVKALMQVDAAYVVPVSSGRRGHPIMIDSSLVNGILSFEGERGLKGAFDYLGVEPYEIPVRDEGISMDADTEKEYLLLLQKHEQIMLLKQKRKDLTL